MKSYQERYGRQGDEQASLVSELSVLGKRRVVQTLQAVLPPHSLKDLQVIFVVEGNLDICIDGELLNVKAGEFVIVRPYEVMSYLKESLPVGLRFFMQIDCHVFVNGTDSEIYSKLIRILQSSAKRIISFNPKVVDLFELLLAEHCQTDDLRVLKAKSLCQALFVDLIRNFQIKTQVQNSEEREFLGQVYERVDDNLSITIAELANELQISENSFRDRFKSLTGQSPKKYINIQLIEKAKNLLCDERLTITDISFALNFSSSQYFSLFFKKNTSMTPFEFRSAMKLFMQDSRPEISSAKEASERLDTYFKLQRK